jgi:general secretion pathway protein M
MTLKAGSTGARFAALALLLAVVSLLVASVAWPVWWLQKRYDDLYDDARDRLGRYQRIAAMRPGIERAIAEVEKREATKHYWKGTTAALVASEIQGAVTKIVESHQGRVFSTQALAAQDDGKASGPPKVSISVQLTAATVPLQLILHTIETHQPYLFVDQLTVRSNQGRGYKPIPGIQPEFSVQMTVRGYGNPGTPKP